ncbi:MAG: hypothetical protein KUG67_01795, partial [Proteobacteria bacterium]|nr:hypothetical protein [Pseudomonadota bacterium]
MSSTGRVIKQIGGFIIRASLFGLILISLLVSLLRLSFGQLPHVRELIESSLSRQLDVELSIGGISGEWEVFDPVLRVTNLKLGMSNSTPVNALVLNTAELRLNVVASLLQQKILFSHISARQWDISLQLNRSDTNSSQFDVKQIVSILSSFESVDITGGRVQLSVDEQVYQLFDASILRTETFFRQKLQASFRLGQKNEAGTDGLDKQNISKEYEAFRFIFNLQKNDDVTGRVYVELPATSISFSSTPWLKDYSDSIPVDNASIAGKFWLDIESSEITRLNSQISFPQIEIQADQSLPVLISD